MDKNRKRPIRDMRAFRHEKGSDANAWVDKYCCDLEDKADFRIAEGYKIAADVLVDNVEEKAETDELVRLLADQMFHPVAFLYRHHIELLLKCILKHQVALRKALVPPESRLWHTHKLHKLRDMAETASGAMFPSKVTVTIREFDTLFRTGQESRYSRHAAGERRYLARAPSSVSLQNLKDKVTEVTELLESVLDMLDAENDAYQDSLG